MNENSFDIITGGNIQQKFIESERSGLTSYLQHYFNNRTLTYQVKIVASAIAETNEEKPLNNKQQFQLLTEQYPLIKELKDRLKLELDY